MLKVGAPAPDFTAKATDGKELSLRSLRGKKVVIFFFPKAFTAGCTIETRRFRDNYGDITALGAEVIGISTDGHETQCRFAGENEVRFPMIGDEDRSISVAFGVRRAILPWDKRVTYVLDEEGVVRAVFEHEIQVSRHLDDVIKFLKAK